MPNVQTLTHDAAGRLTAVAGGASGTTWGYDGRGNLTDHTRGTVDTVYVPYQGNPEEVGLVSVNGSPTVYQYDANGNTTVIDDGSSRYEQLGYDAQSRLSQVTLGSPITETISLAYNAFGQRASYTVTPTGYPASLSETFKYQGDQLAQVAYSGTRVPTPYTDTYIYTQDI